LASVEPIDSDPLDVAPPEAADRQLWRDAQQLLNHHTAASTGDRCTACDRAWPCIGRLTGERAQSAAFKSWNEVWTARHDLRSAINFASRKGERLSATRARGLVNAVEPEEFLLERRICPPAAAQAR
jgi:hypothetical protein